MASRSSSFAGPVSKAGWRKISGATRPTGANFKFFSWLFADNLGRLFVAAQPKEGGMPHLALTRPLGEFYLAYELGNKPGGCVFVLHFLVDRLLVGAQRLHCSIERLQRRLVEASADMPGIDPALLGIVTDCKHQRAKVLARPARLSVTDDHYLLLMHGLELEPLTRSLT